MNITDILGDDPSDTKRIARSEMDTAPVDPLPEPAPIILGGGGEEKLNLYLIDRIDDTSNKYQLYISFLVVAGNEQEARYYAQQAVGRTDSHMNRGTRFSENTFTNPKISRCTQLDLTQAGVKSSVFKGNE